MIQIYFYIVSIPEDTPRREHVSRLKLRLEEMGYNCILVDALYWKYHNVIKTMMELSLPFADGLSQSQIGCFLSHRKAWELVSKGHKDDIHIILEDDMDLIDGFEYKIQMLINRFRPDIDTIILWKHPHQSHNQHSCMTEDDFFSPFYFQWGLCSYMVSPMFAAYLVREMKTLKFPIDLQLATEVLPRHNCLTIVPELFVNLGDLGTGNNLKQVFGSRIWGGSDRL